MNHLALLFTAVIIGTSLPALPALASVSACEDIFSAARVGSILSPKTIPQRVIKYGIVRGLIGKNSSRRSGSTSISSSGAGDPYAAVANRIRRVPPAAALGALNRSYTLGSDISLNHISWFADDNLILEEGSFDGKVRGQDAVLIEGATGQMKSIALALPENLAARNPQHAGVVAFLRTIMHQSQINRDDFDRTPFLVSVESTGADIATYRFLDKQNFRELRDPVFRASSLKVYGNFISFVRDRQTYLTSLSPSDFGPFYRRVVERALPDITVSKVSQSGAFVEGQSQFDVQSWWKFEPSRQAYEFASPGDKVRYEITSANGAVYTVTEESESAWTLQRKGDSLIQKILLKSGHALAKIQDDGIAAKIIEVAGEDELKTIVLQVGLNNLGNYAVNIGNKPMVEVREHHAQNAMAYIQDRFLRFAPTHLIAAHILDRQTGRLFKLSSKYAGEREAVHSTVLDPLHYVTMIDGTLTVRELGTDLAVRTLKFDGEAELVPGTRVLRVVRENYLEFIDTLSESVIWSGPKSSLAALSPDDSRVAYLENGTVHVIVIDGRIESRRTY